MAVVEWPQTLASLLCRDGERRVLPNQAERGGKLGGGEGGTQFVHGRSRMTIDPRIPTMPGRSTSDFH